MGDHATQDLALLYTLPAPYQDNGSWLMNGTTLGIARTLKDGNGNYLWQPSFQQDQPSTRPIRS